MKKEYIKKIDSRLLEIYNDYLLSMEGDSKKAEISTKYSLALRFQGDIKDIENLGFETSWNQTPGFANGIIHLKDLERIASHPNVISISYGDEKEPYLDGSVGDIKVRANTPSNIGTTGLWHINPADGKITSSPSGYSGKGVIVGIIDTGIDVGHPSFTTGKSPNIKSRILRYWDQGLKAQTGENGPNANLFTHSSTYGVEYNEQQISDVLNKKAGAISIRSKDCIGHGTHVAGTAAGNGNPDDKKYRFVGVAPEADIVAVKLLDNPGPVFDINNVEVSPNTMFQDAFMYVLKLAKKKGKKAVINCSFGNSFGAHDGLSNDEQWLDDMFSSGKPFYQGNIVVYSAGNAGGRRRHARITIPVVGKIKIPFTLYHEGNKTGNYETVKPNKCKSLDNTRDMKVELWYKALPSSQSLTVKVRTPTKTSFFPNNGIKLGDEKQDYFDRKRYFFKVSHSDEPAVTITGTSNTVDRNRITLVVKPNKLSTPDKHREGLYEIEITGPQGTVIHAWTSRDRMGNGFRVGTYTKLKANANASATELEVKDITGFKKNEDITIQLNSGNHKTKIANLTRKKGINKITLSTPIPSDSNSDNSVEGVLHADIILEDRFLIGSDGGAKQVITVAAYADESKNPDGVVKSITSFSSRGPLVDYSGQGTHSTKPNIAAPGRDIVASLSQHKRILGRLLKKVIDNKWVPFSGTSMSAPHITGLIALMLQKDKTLNVDKVKAIFSTTSNNQDGTNPKPTNAQDYKEAYGGGIVDGKKAIDAV